MQKIVFTLYLALELLVFSCTTVKQDKNDELFTSDYISARGYGHSIDGSKSSALSELSRYFSTQINVHAVGKTVATDDGSQEQIEEIVQVLSNTELFAVHYTKPVYNKIAQQYEIIAYIDREEAWKIFEPKLREKLNLFYSIYQEAIASNEPFTQLQLLQKAEKYTADASKFLQFAYALSSEKSAQYSSENASLDNFNVNTIQAKSQCTISIKCSKTSEALKAAVEDILNKSNFTLTDNKPNYICTVELSENKSVMEAGVFFTPSIAITITSTVSGVDLFSWSNTFSRIGASSENVALQRMYDEVQKSIKELLSKVLGEK